jgi:hypothetical protein
MSDHQQNSKNYMELPTLYRTGNILQDIIINQGFTTYQEYAGNHNLCDGYGNPNLWHKGWWLASIYFRGFELTGAL